MRTRLVLVARAQRPTLREAARTHEELAAIGLSQQHLVINGVFPAGEAENDTLAAAIYEREQATLAAIPQALQALPRDQIALKPFNLVGLDALRHLLVATDVTHSADAIELPDQINAPDLSALVDDIAADGHGLVMVMGKGGVGKTTLAAAIAVELACRGLPVHLTTSDPAAHLADTLEGSLPNLTLSRIDPQEVTERYRQHVMDTRARSSMQPAAPCWKKTCARPAPRKSRCSRRSPAPSAKGKKVRGDGYRTHGPHLAVARRHRRIPPRYCPADGETGVHFTTPMMQLQDPKQTKVLIVTLAETTPVLEAANLQDDLRRAGIEPWAWVVNNSVAAAHRIPRCCASARATNCGKSTPWLRDMPGAMPSYLC